MKSFSTFLASAPKKFWVLSIDFPLIEIFIEYTIMATLQKSPSHN